MTKAFESVLVPPFLSFAPARPETRSTKCFSRFDLLLKIKAGGKGYSETKIYYFVSRTSWEDRRNLVRANKFTGLVHVAKSSSNRTTCQRQPKGIEEDWTRGGERVQVNHHRESHWSVDAGRAFSFPWGPEALWQGVEASLAACGDQVEYTGPKSRYKALNFK